MKIVYIVLVLSVSCRATDEKKLKDGNKKPDSTDYVQIDGPVLQPADLASIVAYRKGSGGYAIPYPIHVPRPYPIPVPIPVNVPRPVAVPVPQPVAIAVPHPVGVPVPRPYAVPVPHPIPVPSPAFVGLDNAGSGFGSGLFGNLPNTPPGFGYAFPNSGNVFPFGSGKEATSHQSFIRFFGPETAYPVAHQNHGASRQSTDVSAADLKLASASHHISSPYHPSLEAYITTDNRLSDQDGKIESIENHVYKPRG